MTSSCLSKTMVSPLLLAVALIATCSSFSPVHRPLATRSALSPLPSAACFGSKREPCRLDAQAARRRSSALFTKEESLDPEEVDTTAVEGASDKKEDESSDDSRSLITTLLLAVPLFCKFVVVLLIKFMTDLVVFPLLFLYRMAHLAKRKVLGLFGSGKINGGDPVNGASK